MSDESLVLQLLHEVRENQEAMKARFDFYDAKCTEVDEMHERLLQAFPSSDILGHRRYHENVIAWLEMRNNLVREALSMAAKTGGVAALGWICYALWQALKMEFHK